MLANIYCQFDLVLILIGLVNPIHRHKHGPYLLTEENDDHLTPFVKSLSPNLYLNENIIKGLTKN